MLQWLFYLLVIIQTSCTSDNHGPADFVVPSTVETPNKLGGSSATTDVAIPTDALKSATPQAVNSHTITASEFAKKTAAVNGDQSGEQRVAGDNKNPTAGDIVRPVTQQQQASTKQDGSTSSSPNSVSQANPVALGNSAAPAISSQQLSSSTSAKTDRDTSLKVLAEQQPSNVEHKVNANTQKNVPLLLQPQVQGQEAKGIPPSTLEGASHSSTSSQQQHGDSSQTTARLPTSDVLPTLQSTMKPTIAVEKIGPQLISSDLHKEGLQKTTHPTNAVSQKVAIGVGDSKEIKGHLDKTIKEHGEIFVSSNSNPTNKQASLGNMTEDKGGGNRAIIGNDNVSSMKPLHSIEEIRQYSLTDLSNKISYEIKQYRDNVSTAWESRKLASWTVEATSYLKDYMDAISISKSVNNSACVENDLRNYDLRSKVIQEIIESCRKGLKRESWKELQDKTSNILISFDKIVQNATNIIGMLNKQSDLFDVIKIAVEDYAKNRLCLIDTQLLRKSLSELKELSLKTDKEEYLKCIDSKPEKSMIRDTMSDIMRIKNNCV